MGLYIVQFSLFLAVFYVAYLLFLKKETFFDYNRLYLLLTPCLALLLPFITLDFLRPKDSTGTAYINLPPVLLGDFAVAAEETQAVTHNLEGINWTQILWQNGFLILYGIGFSIAFLLLIKKWNQFRKFKQSGILKQQDGIFYSEIKNSRIACTFYNQIFIGSEIKEKERQHILQHEWVHVTQNHSLDLLFFEILKLLFWFHPAVFAYQKQITSLHEFIADEHVTQNTSKINYYQSLLNVAFGTHQISFINQFFNHSLIKKRIVMLQKSKSAAQAKLKYLIILPLIAAMLTYVSCTENKETVETNQSELPDPPPPPAPPANLSQEDAQLVNELQEELVRMKNDGKTTKEIAKEFYDVNIHKSTPSRENYYRSMLYMKYTYQDYNNSVDSDKKIEDFEIIPYDEYLEFRKYTKNALLPPPPPPATHEEGVPFSAIETVPTYPGCDEESNNTIRKQCFSDKIKDFVNNNFDVGLGKKLGLTGENRVYVRFVIAKDGSIKDVQARAPHPKLQEEAERVVNSLPKMQPGIQNSQPVNVLYSLPIIFKID
ncbi:beta-lactamase regulating signal transducer with metallopeptidase domain [Mesonia algae]|uniref:Beta-lactamase regulating signal transducer with metallopeptidase domain n=1 Tax=Mesonia algae TaxID=213248 RepID=A0A2W7HV72_9FLAO|nr:M56 family metallopeptidase [Mesonia algae]PZW38641.1 beta-lactamase regulating signal transducer with metallopeptidase domain [Mesonia algae]